MPHDIHVGDALATLKTLPDNHFDAMLCDPPYGITFMGKEWDKGVPSAQVWAEALRVLKPGAYALVACGTRTQHRMVTNLEDAGFEVRDVIAWLYGSGFPKSHDVSKAIDKVRDWSKVESLNREIRRARAETGMSLAAVGNAMKTATNGQYGAWYHRGGHMFFETGRSLPSRPEWERLREVLPIADEWQEVYAEAEREVTGTRAGSLLAVAPGQDNDRSRTELDLTAPATPDAVRWQGYGTALKPAMELWTLVRKPPEGTVAANCLKHGVGGLNIDGTRIPTDDRVGGGANATSGFVSGYDRGDGWTPGHDGGRWPANVIHDGSDEVLELFPDTESGGARRSGQGGNGANGTVAFRNSLNANHFAGTEAGSAARFFYTAKASRREREAGLDGREEQIGKRYGEQGQGPSPQQTPRVHKPTTNPHPTVKPLALTEYLARLLLPPARNTPRRILTPFSGVGSEMIGALRAGWDHATGIELDPEYVQIAHARIDHWVGADLDEPEAPPPPTEAAPLFASTD